MQDIDIAIGILDKLIAREREAADNGMRMGNRILEENASVQGAGREGRAGRPSG